MKHLFAIALVFISLQLIAKYQGASEVVSQETFLAAPSNYFLLDVRSAEEFQAGHIKGALNVPHSSIDEQLEQLKATNKPILVYCRSGRRAAIAEKVLMDNGFKQVMHLQGDMNGWLANNHPVVSLK